jgi:hypothetical protein
MGLVETNHRSDQFPAGDGYRRSTTSSDSDLVVSFLQATADLPASAVARVCGLDGQTIQNLRYNRIKRIRRNTRERITHYLNRTVPTLESRRPDR